MKFIYSSVFKKQYRKLPKKIQEHLEMRVVILANTEFHPLLNNHKLHGEYSDYRSINISGNIRLVYKKINKETVYLMAIGTHSELYE